MSLGLFPVIDQSQAFIAGYSDDSERVIRDDLPLVIFGDHTRCVKYVDFPFILGADGTKVLKPKEDLFDPKFFYYALLSLDIPNRGYNRHFTLLKEKKVPRPEKDEQRKIAAVLGVVQRAIEQQERLLQLTAELKKALLHQLFTQGLRGEPQKQTEIGLVPKSWEVRRLEEVATVIMGQSPAGESYNADGKGVPLINGPVEFGPNPLSKTLEVKFTTEPTKLCEQGDLILCVRGSTTGRTNVANGAACIGRGVAAVRARGVQEYLNQFMVNIRDRIYAMGTGTTFPNVSGSQIKEILVPIPPLEEQSEIGGILANVDYKYELLERKRAALTDLFRTMLHQLMTARIRIHNLDLQELEATVVP